MDYGERLYDMCYTVAESLAYATDEGLKRRFYKNQGEKMRLLWESERSGKRVIDLFREVMQLPDDYPINDWVIRDMLDMPGFLSRKEWQATKAIRGKTIEVWRGRKLAENERKDYGILWTTKDGYSWTTDEDIARRFAACWFEPAVVVRAHVSGDDCYVLHNADSEIVVLGDVAIQEVIPCTWQWSSPDLDEYQPVPVSFV
jgi:hypothetical protein